MQKQIVHCIFGLLLSMFMHVGSSRAQLYLEYKEKIYVQTNHVFFQGGETVFFKLYVVKAKDQTPTKVSNTVYVELISPSGTVAKKAQYGISDGYAEGSFDFEASAPGGVYKLRAYTNWMKNEDEGMFFVKELTLQKVIAPRVLLKLDFPEKGYGPSSAVIASFSMRSLNDLPIRNYTCNYTVSIAGTAIQQSSFTTNGEGKATVKFNLPANLSSSDGLLSITVNYEGYSESVSRSIPIVLNKLDLQFMPEGGTWVNGYNSRIAFRAVNEFGKAADVKGYIQDSEGNKVASFESYHFGMGVVELTPVNGQCYKAVVTSPAGIKERYDLPLALLEGVALRVNHNGQKLQLQISSSSTRDVKLKISSRETIYNLQQVSLKPGTTMVELDEAVFPAGINVVALATITDLPLAERLVYLHEDRELQVKITTARKKYGPREKVKMQLQTLDEFGKALPANLSLAVVDDKLWTMADDKQDHILSWLHLSSELKGKVEEPQFYFKKDEPKAKPALDMLLLTQGYRYYQYTEFVTKQNNLQYMPDQDNILAGTVLDEHQYPVQAEIILATSYGNYNAIKTVTEPDGSFFFSNLLPGMRYYVFAKPVEGDKTLTIRVDQNGTGYNPSRARALRSLLSPYRTTNLATAVPATGPYPSDPQIQQMAPDLMNRINNNNALNEVVVTAYGTQSRKALAYSTTVVRGADITQAKSITQALTGRVAGLQITTMSPGAVGGERIILRGTRSITGSNTPLFVVDGIPMENFNMNELNPNDISDISVFKSSAATAIFGAAASDGAILINLKKTEKPGVTKLITKGNPYTSVQVQTQYTTYTPVKHFYVPEYKTTETEERTDFRETIYWNSVVQTDEEGKATVEFYNSDASTTFRAIAEGIGFNGKAGRAEATYAVENMLQVDAKIPPYLTVGDKARIPLVIKNNSEEEATYTIQAKVPGAMQVGDYTSTVQLAAGTAEQVLIPLEAIKAFRDSVTLQVYNDEQKETIKLPISAVDKGFPVRLTISGNKQDELGFSLGDTIPGTLHTDLRLFRDVQGHLTDGIESMLREPYGCFEQTSSSTYPNIMILKYLRESGRSNPLVEKKALELIQRGYERLIGFETQANGFEWFGRTPPHEALTAYGLLEFNDMKSFINVNEAMLARTKKFLLSRRDGKGGFQLEKRGLDAFASVPDRIANIYIVYSMVKAGAGSEIKKEYDAAVSQALASKDGYMLSMMAIAASMMNDTAAYQQLMAQLKAVESMDGLGAMTTVTNSRGVSLKVEASALYAMALMKAPQPDMGKVAALISNILSEKSYYGYGSTQSTVLALQALVEYARFSTLMAKDEEVLFTLNGQPVKPGYEVAPLLKKGNNNLSVKFKEPGQRLPYGLSISYQTYTPVNNAETVLRLRTSLATPVVKAGETVRMNIQVYNTKNELQPMSIVKIGIPAGLSVQPWQLKELMEQNKVAYYEIFDNYLVLYWMGFAAQEVKNIGLDLKADIPGTYRAKASNVYLYYTPEHKWWNEGTIVEVKE